MGTLQRIKEYIDYKNVTNQKFEKSVGFSNGAFASQLKNNRTIGVDKLENILITYPDLNPTWLLTGHGSMIKGETDYESKQNRHLIPFYEDVRSIGGTCSIAETNNTAYPSEMIDAGDWFPEATAAMRHYGDSMVEYPSGCILAIKRVIDRRLLMWGKNYVIETCEYRVTKKLHQAKEGEILAYSTNTETYPDGRLIYQPFIIPMDAIINIDLVLGCVTKEYSNGPIVVK